MNQSAPAGIKKLSVFRFNGTEGLQTDDIVAVEEPLEIQLECGPHDNRIKKPLSVTMRTPGHDEDLAVGFLFTEGIVFNRSDIIRIVHENMHCLEQKKNVVAVKLNESFSPALKHAEKNFYTTSSCGVCGKSSINAIRTVSKSEFRIARKISVSSDLLLDLPERLMIAQNNFSASGGIHASALFSLTGDLLLLYEDVGRHNALDKLIGRAFLDNLLPLDQHILVLSGRASFELVQKAAMAGIQIIAAIGAPSSLAVELALEFNITLVGFLRNNRYNIYTLGNRLFCVDYEN